MMKGILFSFCKADRNTVISVLKHSEDVLLCWVSGICCVGIKNKLFWKLDPSTSLGDIVWGLKTDQIIWKMDLSTSLGDIVWRLKTDQIILETGSVYILGRYCLGIKNRSDHFGNWICLHPWAKREGGELTAHLGGSIRNS